VSDACDLLGACVAGLLVLGALAGALALWGHSIWAELPGDDDDEA